MIAVMVKRMEWFWRELQHSQESLEVETGPTGACCSWSRCAMTHSDLWFILLLHGMNTKLEVDLMIPYRNEISTLFSFD